MMSTIQWENEAKRLLAENGRLLNQNERLLDANRQLREEVRRFRAADERRMEIASRCVAQIVSDAAMGNQDGQ